MSFQNFGPVVCMSTEAVSYVSLTYSFTKTGLHRLDDLVIKEYSEVLLFFFFFF